jgi:phytoene dehydrogenase-like protein
MNKKIIIIGGGIAGLSAGCYGRMNGYDTEIFEMHTVPGGVCTGWKRRGYTFDGCLHFLVGTSSENPFHRIWQELGAFDARRVVDHEVFCDVELPDGTRLAQYADVDRLVASLERELPGLDRHDVAALDQLAADVKLWGTIKMPLAPAAGGATAPRGPIARASALARRLRGMWKMRALFPVFKRFAGGVPAFAARFHSPQLQSFFESVNPIPGMPATSILMILSMNNTKDGGWPEGGSLALARSIARRYEELGGRIRYGARVEKILVRDGQAVGVRLADGQEHFADEVISAADGHATLFGMLEGRYLGGGLDELYRTLPLYTPLVQVSLGVKRDLRETGGPRLTTVRFAEPLAMGGTRASFIMLNNYAFDRTMAPEGGTAVSVLFPSPWEHWEKLAGDRPAYLAEKARVLADATAWLEARYPGISRDIEATDVATPLTTVRYTGNYHGSYEGWRPTAETMRVSIPKRIPGLARFSMVGQWTAPFAGLPSVASDGRNAIRELCAQDGREFRTWTTDEQAAAPAGSGERVA